MHLAKYKGADCARMTSHYARSRESGKYKNTDIDKDKTELNYNLGPARAISEKEFIETRVSEVKHLNRADVVKMCDWVITLPQDYRGSQEAFFKAAYEEFKNLYLEKNVVSAYVHLDEKTPHMHFSFVPVYTDADGQERLNAKKLITRQHLKEIHPMMERRISDRLHEPVRLMNGATRDGNKSIDELKRTSAKMELDKIHALEKLKAEQIEPAKPTRSITGRETVPYEVYRRHIEAQRTIIQRQELKLTEVREKAFSQQGVIDRLKDTVLRQNEFYNDRERLLERAEHLDRTHEERERAHERER